MSCFMYDGGGNQFRAWPFGHNKLPIQSARTHRYIKPSNRSGDVPNPYTFNIATKAVVAKLVVCLDEAQRFFDATQEGLRLETCYPNPKTINPLASGKAKFEPVDKSGTLALPHGIHERCHRFCEQIVNYRYPLRAHDRSGSIASVWQCPRHVHLAGQLGIAGRRAEGSRRLSASATWPAGRFRLASNFGRITAPR
jgi:hypothetical protein